ncbi:Cro/CI family transcriptional regulator [Halomonas koreensis]|uniref:Cro/CI family transcriptional regulator n=1 Tax=Halomonas koreensis TaxID=245385 RepID=A0ABU1G2U5_9GAMM|nr:Cro/CI family transcriptional regulator [Halomonas koreensis]MDR5867272.1 Cro/CI family transcriptional regulator [Halomonas koreensis]
MKKADAIDHFGSKAALAAALGITVQAIAQWGEDVPARRSLELEKVTGGALRAEPPLREPGMRATTAA